MPNEIDTKALSYPINPSIIVDDFKAGDLSVWLSPEIALSTFSIKQCFDNVPFKGEARKEWAALLREIADNIDKDSQ